MAFLAFGNVAADMRFIDGSYGMPAMLSYFEFVAGFSTVQKQTLLRTASVVSEQRLDASGDALTLTLNGNIAANQATSFTVEGRGVALQVLGSFAIDANLAIHGTTTAMRATLIADGSTLFQITNVAVPTTSTPTAPATFAGADFISGTPLADVLYGYEGNDVLVGGRGDDTLHGGDGVDVAVYSGNRADYALTGRGLDISVQDLSGNEGTDLVIGIHRFRFADRNLAIDLGVSQAAADTAKIIGAAFGTHNLSLRPDWVAIGLELFSAGFDMLQVSGLALGTAPYKALAGSDSDADFVSTVYRNVVGEAPSPNEHAFYVAMLQGSGGTMTQSELLMFAANTAANAENIGLDDLQSHAAGHAVRLIGAAFGEEYVRSRPDWVGAWLEFFDSGGTLLEACGIALGTTPYLDRAGSSSNEAFVSTVYQNVVGSAPTSEDHAYYVEMLEGSGGTMTQAELLMFAANTVANAVHIDLAGLQTTGVEYVV